MRTKTRCFSQQPSFRSIVEDLPAQILVTEFTKGDVAQVTE